MNKAKQRVMRHNGSAINTNRERNSLHENLFYFLAFNLHIINGMSFAFAKSMPFVDSLTAAFL